MSCSYCHKRIGDKSHINCSICYQSTHIHCSQTYSDEIPVINTPITWFCKHCLGSILPFNHILDDDEFLHVINELNNNQIITFTDLQKLHINPFNLNENTDNDNDPNKHYELNNINDKCNYYCSDSLNNKTKQLLNPKLSLIHFNSRSLIKNLDNITDYLETLDHKFPIIAFSESWLNDSNPSPLLSILMVIPLPTKTGIVKKEGVV